MISSIIPQGLEVASVARPTVADHDSGLKCSTDWGHRFPDWTFGFRQFSFTLIARVLRHLTLQHFQVTIAFTACCCSLSVSRSGKPVTQEHPSKFFLAVPGISLCVTWRTLTGCRPSPSCAKSLVSCSRCPLRRFPLLVGWSQRELCKKIVAFPATSSTGDPTVSCGLPLYSTTTRI